MRGMFFLGVDGLPGPRGQVGYRRTHGHVPLSGLRVPKVFAVRCAKDHERRSCCPEEGVRLETMRTIDKTKLRKILKENGISSRPAP